MPKDKHHKVSSKGGINSRSSETQTAWDEREYIIEARKTKSVAELAKEYNIDKTQIYRIIKG